MNNRPEEPASWSDHPSESSTAERWEIDAARSTLTFKLRHIVILQIRGRFERWGGTIFIDREQPWRSSVDAWVDLSSITTDDADRDAHVRSSEFLDVQRFPRASFRSAAVDVRDRQVSIEGKLDLHGTVQDVRIGAAALEPGGGTRCRYKGRATINRQAFGLHWNQDLDVGGVVVGDQVEIDADVELVRADRR